jgi:hypothetical protein
LTPHIDGDFVDKWSIVFGVVYALVKHGLLFYRKQAHAMSGPRFGFSIVNGLALFPVTMLTIGSISSDVLTMLLHGSRITLFIAGVVAFFAILSAE